MAAEKFSEFTEAATCDSSDRIVGYNGTDNTQYTPEQIANNIGDGVVTTDKLADDSVSTDKIIDGNVTTAKLADNSVTTAKVADGQITTEKIQDDAVTFDKLADDSVTGDRVADGAITTNKIQNGAITTNKIQNDAVTSDKIADWDVIMKTDEVQTNLAEKVFLDGTLKVRNSSDGGNVNITYDSAAGDDSDVIIPDATPFGGTVNMQIVEDLSTDIDADTGSDVKYPSVGAVENYMNNAVKSVQVTLSAAQVLNGGISFIEIIPAQGASKIIQVHSAMMYYTYNTIPFSGGTSIFLDYIKNGVSVMTPIYNNSNLLGQTQDALADQVNSPYSLANQNIKNASIAFSTDGYNAGNGTLTLLLTYSVLSL